MRAVCRVPGNEIKENEKITGTRARAKARGQEREEKKKRGRQEQINIIARVKNECNTVAKIAKEGQVYLAIGLGTYINLYTNLALRLCT